MWLRSVFERSPPNFTTRRFNYFCRSRYGTDCGWSLQQWNYLVWTHETRTWVVCIWKEYIRCLRMNGVNHKPKWLGKKIWETRLFHKIVPQLFSFTHIRLWWLLNTKYALWNLKTNFWTLTGHSEIHTSYITYYTFDSSTAEQRLTRAVRELSPSYFAYPLVLNVLLHCHCHRCHFWSSSLLEALVADVGEDVELVLSWARVS